MINDDVVGFRENTKRMHLIFSVADRNSTQIMKPNAEPIAGNDSGQLAREIANVVQEIRGYDRILLNEAKRCANRAVRAHRRNNAELEAGATAACILCSAAACEGRLSEWLAARQAKEKGLELPNKFLSIRKQRDAQRQWKQLLKLCAPAFDPGRSAEYEALGCLFTLRDHIAHRSARPRPLDEFPKELATCIRQKVMRVRHVTGVDWTSIVYVHEVARWSIETSSKWLAIVYNLAPMP